MRFTFAFLFKLRNKVLDYLLHRYPAEVMQNPKKVSICVTITLTSLPGEHCPLEISD